MAANSSRSVMARASGRSPHAARTRSTKACTSVVRTGFSCKVISTTYICQSYYVVSTPGPGGAGQGPRVLDHLACLVEDHGRPTARVVPVPAPLLAGDAPHPHAIDGAGQPLGRVGT